ncbi:MAG TPA: M56 family metallopeptidase [Actinomycetota bacterium]|nr:M56 family metallopeptidase [Actinomycetota bacterium]
MRLVLAGGTFLAFLWLPHLARGALVSRGTPRLLFWFGLLSLSGISAAFVGLLVAMVSPEPANVASLPRVVEICVDAATRLLAYPLGHWPSIVAALLLLGFLVRAATGWAQTFRDSRRARPPRGDLPGERLAKRRYLGRSDRGVRVLPSDEPVAYTVGLLRPRTVLSVGLLRSLGDRERQAVLAHEEAHARRRHTLVLFAASAIGRAFGFIPSVRLSVTYVVTALEATADEAAADRVGDPLVVAEALASVARLRLAGAHPAPGMGSGDVAYRVRRLTGERPPERAGRLVVAVAALALAVLAVQGAWSTGRALAGGVAAERHAPCHGQHAAASVL